MHCMTCTHTHIHTYLVPLTPPSHLITWVSIEYNTADVLQSTDIHVGCTLWRVSELMLDEQDQWGQPQPFMQGCGGTDRTGLSHTAPHWSLCRSVLLTHWLDIITVTLNTYTCTIPVSDITHHWSAPCEDTGTLNTS